MRSCFHWWLASICLAGWAALPAAGAEPAGRPLILQDLSNWREDTGQWMLVGEAATDQQDQRRLVVQPGQGVLVNGPSGRTTNLLTRREHGDVECHVEFMVPAGSNSGVYFQGRYEIQILDSWGVEKPGYGDCGGVYQRWRDGQGFEGRAPSVNASKPPGQWQTFEVIFQAPRFDEAGRKTANARFVKVLHNGQLVHEDVELTGPTRAAAFEDEQPRGPLMLQGDHGPVAYRNLRIRAR